MRRAARFGDGWYPYMYTPEMYASSIATVDAARERDVPVRRGVFIWGCVHEDRATAERWVVDSLSRTYAQDFARLAAKYAFAGTPDDVVARLGEYVDAGAELVVAGLACPPVEIESTTRLFGTHVLPALRARGRG